MAKKNPCMSCADYCDETCPLYGATPVKLYTPKGAARAMLAGKVLKGKWGWEYFWGGNEMGEVSFFCKANDGDLLHAVNFSGLYEELA
jgi:Fe-S oxidoreductase